MDEAGIEPERFAIEWVSSAESARFAEIVTKFTNTVLTLGPNPLNVSKAG